MRYPESRERSVEVLRLALAQMGRHDAAFNPMTFAVWYEHAAGTNARLSQALNECLRTEPRLGTAAVARLYFEHVAELDQPAIQRASIELERLMSGMAESAARTGDRASEFGKSLNGLEHALHGTTASELEPAVSRALGETDRMKETAAELQRQVVAGRQEIEQLRGELSRARDEVLMDPLTGLVNRKGFDQRLSAMLELALLKDHSHWLAMFDIDHFKAVNDSFGHVMGDRVLQAVADELRAAVADPAHCVARYGGEEFAMLLPNCSQQMALALVEAGRQRVKALKFRDRRTHSVMLTVTISAGLTSLRSNDDAQSLIAHADKALYAAKQAGRDRVNLA